MEALRNLFYINKWMGKEKLFFGFFFNSNVSQIFEFFFIVPQIAE